MSRVFRHLLAIFAVFGLIAIDLAPIAEAWSGPDAAAHVEQRGTQLHYAHNEATCPACVTRTLVSRGAASAAPAPDVRASETASVMQVERPAHSQVSRSNGSRAPPLTASR